MSQPNKRKADFDNYIKKVQEMRANKEESGSGSDFVQRANKVRRQGYSAARQGKIYPRELQNVPGDRWEDAKVYGTDTRQGQNHWRDHLKSRAEEMAKRKKKW